MTHLGGGGGGVCVTDKRYSMARWRDVRAKLVSTRVREIKEVWFAFKHLCRQNALPRDRIVVLFEDQNFSLCIIYTKWTSISLFCVSNWKCFYVCIMTVVQIYLQGEKQNKRSKGPSFYTWLLKICYCDYAIRWIDISAGSTVSKKILNLKKIRPILIGCFNLTTLSNRYKTSRNLSGSIRFRFIL